MTAPAVDRRGLRLIVAVAVTGLLVLTSLGGRAIGRTSPAALLLLLVRERPVGTAPPAEATHASPVAEDLVRRGR